MAAQRPKYSYPGWVATARNTLPLSARTGRRAPTPWPAGRDLSAAANGRIYISFISFTLSREDGHIDMAALLTQQTPGAWRGKVRIAADFDQLPAEIEAAFRGEGS